MSGRTNRRRSSVAPAIASRVVASASMSPICALIFDDNTLYREGLAKLLWQEEYVGRVETAPEPNLARAAIHQRRPDVVLLNMAMSRGLENLRLLVHEFPGIRVIALDVPDRSDGIVTCVEAGAVGYLSREGSLQDLATVIQSVARGEAVCSPRIAATLFRRVATLASERQSVSESVHLTPREREIIHLIDQGLSNKDIAQRLHIDVQTVKNHVHNILEKLQVHRRGEAAARMRHVALEAATASSA